MKKKSLTMLLCAALVITTAALGSIAYLTDAAHVTNRFTVGNVSLKVEETLVNEDGKPVDADGNLIDPNNPNQQPVLTEEGNVYHLLPGQPYTKDPTVTIEEGSEESYVRMLVTLTYFDRIKAVLGEDFLPENHVTGYDAAKWPCVAMTPGTELNAAGETVQTMTYEFRYYVTVDGMDNDLPADTKLEPLFTAFTVPGALTGDQLAQLQPMEIRVIGQAIQVAGFNTADEAWVAFSAQADQPANQDQQGQP